MLQHPFKDNILREPAPKSAVLICMHLPASGYIIPPQNPAIAKKHHSAYGEFNSELFSWFFLNLVVVS